MSECGTVSWDVIFGGVDMGDESKAFWKKKIGHCSPLLEQRDNSWRRYSFQKIISPEIKNYFVVIS